MEGGELMATEASHRLLLLTMEPSTALELAKLGGAITGGAFGLELLRRFFGWRKRRAEEPVELKAKIIDDGDKFRELLLDEFKRMNVENAELRERAHQAETRLAVLQAEHSRLHIRLERKDEAQKVLVAQLVQLGQIPATIRGGGPGG